MNPLPVVFYILDLLWNVQISFRMKISRFLNEFRFHLLVQAIKPSIWFENAGK